MSAAKSVKESALDAKDAVLDVIVAAGEPWVGCIAEGQVFRIVDLEGNQAVDTLFYSAADPRERYSAQRYHPHAGQHLPHDRHACCVRRRARRC